MARQEDSNIAEIKGILHQIIGSNRKMQENITAHDSVIRGIETQLGQLSLSLNNRPQGTLPANTNTNQRSNPNQLMAMGLKKRKRPR